MGWMAEHAVVIGGSIAGLCAARVLAEHYRHITVYERDALPDGPDSRAAVPQDRHVHMLMARGAQEFETLFPGLLADMVDAGVPILQNRPDAIHFGAAGHVLGTDHTLRDAFTAYVPSRPHLEWQIRRRVAAMDTVDIVHAAVTEPVYDPARRAVTGVRLAGDDTADVVADLVVDATGRGTRLPVWLQQWGFGRPPEQTVKVGISYATHKMRVADNAAVAEKVVVAGATHARPLGLGMLFYEDGNWNLTTFGVAGAQPPDTFDGMRALAQQILPPHLAAAVTDAEPIGAPALHKYPTSRWRRYHELGEMPSGIIPFGDSVVSFNPTFGQGMTMTAIQAANLRAALPDGPHGLAERLNTATAKTTYPVWTMNAIGDFTLHGATGEHPRWFGPVGGLFDQFLGAAETDSVLAEWFLRRFSLLDTLWMVPSPSLIARAARHNLRAWRDGRRAR